MLKMFDFICPVGHRFEALVEPDEMPVCPICENQAVEKCLCSPKYHQDIVSYINNELNRPCSQSDVPHIQKWV